MSHIPSTQQLKISKNDNSRNYNNIKKFRLMVPLHKCHLNKSSLINLMNLCGGGGSGGGSGGGLCVVLLL